MYTSWKNLYLNKIIDEILIGITHKEIGKFEVFLKCRSIIQCMLERLSIMGVIDILIP